MLNFKEQFKKVSVCSNVFMHCQQRVASRELSAESCQQRVASRELSLEEYFVDTFKQCTALIKQIVYGSQPIINIFILY